MATTQDGSKLLNLPMELLQKVSELSSSETLITFRLTCKTLDLASFDQFAAAYFEKRTCHILSASGWSKFEKRLHDFPRLANKIQRVNLTTDILDNRSLPSLQLAPESSFYHIREAQRSIHERTNSAAYQSRPTLSSKRPNTAMVMCVIRQLQAIAP